MTLLRYMAATFAALASSTAFGGGAFKELPGPFPIGKAGLACAGLGSGWYLAEEVEKFAPTLVAERVFYQDPQTMNIVLYNKGTGKTDPSPKGVEAAAICYSSKGSVKIEDVATTTVASSDTGAKKEVKGALSVSQAEATCRKLGAKWRVAAFDDDFSLQKIMSGENIIVNVNRGKSNEYLAVYRKASKSFLAGGGNTAVAVLCSDDRDNASIQAENEETKLQSEALASQGPAYALLGSDEPCVRVCRLRALAKKQGCIHKPTYDSCPALGRAPDSCKMTWWQIYYSAINKRELGYTVNEMKASATAPVCK